MTSKWSLFLFLVLTSFISQSATSVMDGNLEKQQSMDKLSSYTLSSMDDVEMLTYFLLWRYGYFNHTSDHHHPNHGESHFHKLSILIFLFIKKSQQAMIIMMKTNWANQNYGSSLKKSKSINWYRIKVMDNHHRPLIWKCVRNLRWTI